MNSYYNELKTFIAQADDIQKGKGDLKRAQYVKSFMDLAVKVNTRQANGGRKVPSIAFLGGNNTVQKGIYPVYLYYREAGILILAYGISEARPPEQNWNISNTITIFDYFLEHNVTLPARYGQSLVYRIYNVKKLPNKTTIDNDLKGLLEFYQAMTVTQKQLSADTAASPVFSLSKLYNDLQAAHYHQDTTLIWRFVAALITKPFVILTGLSGSGKTRLAAAFATWICADESQYLIVPVGADWTNRDPLLGYTDALNPHTYVLPENGALALIIEASKNPSKPYFLILDEMNLSHVERYFADFLSVMESEGELLLHPPGDEWKQSKVPAKVALPKNLFIIGTVNIDETTYMFSPKVLDRANVIEFRVTRDEMAHFLQNPSRINMTSLSGAGALMADGLLQLATDNNIISKVQSDLSDVLLDFFTELKPLGAEFGYRTAYEIARFAGVVEHLETSWVFSDIVDAAIMQKLLPKIHGSRRKLERVLESLAKRCLKDPAKVNEILKLDAVNDYQLLANYPLSLEKIVRMYKNAIANGFTSFAEA